MPKRTCSGTALKRFACLTMLIDHIGASCLTVGFGALYIPLYNEQYFTYFTSETTPFALLLINSIFRTIGRLAMPIFAFFIVEGFLHTKNAAKYLLRLTCFGIISEPFFDFAFFRTFYNPQYQNIYATLSLALLGLMLLQLMEQCPYHTNTTKRIGITVLSLLGIFATLAAADLLHTDYGSTGVVLILALYLVRKTKALQSMMVVFLTLEQFPASLAAIPLALYNGQRGNCGKWERWAFYAFYPTHLLILGLITNFVIL